jgi:serine/threonine protein kinase
MQALRQLGRFEVQAVVGQGPLGLSLKARDTLLDRTVIVRRRNASLLAGDVLSRYQAHLSATGALHVPGIATFYETERRGDELLVVRQYVDGESLQQNLLSGFSAILNHRFSVLDQIVSSLRALHRAGWFHGNLKPSNVILPRAGEQPILTDLSCSSSAVFIRGEIREQDLVHLSPEHIAESAQIDARSDVFCLGVLAFELLTRHSPFPGATLDEKVANLCRGERLPAARFAPEIAGLDALLNKALAPDAARRCTIEEFAIELAPLRVRLGSVDPDATISLLRSSLPAVSSRSGAATAVAPARDVWAVAVPSPPVQRFADRADMAKPTPNSRLRSPVQARPAWEGGRSRTPAGVGYLFFTVVLLIGGVAAFWHSVANIPYPLLPRQAAVTMTPQAAKPLSFETVVQVNAAPWGQIKSVTALDGRRIGIDQRVTPVQLRVLPGTYRIVAVGPDGKTERTAVVEIAEGETSFVRFEFQAVDARAIVDGN